MAGGRSDWPRMQKKPVDSAKTSTSAWPFWRSTSTTWGNRWGKACWPTTKRSDRWRPVFCRRRAGSRNWGWRQKRRSHPSNLSKSLPERRCPMMKNEQPEKDPQSMVERFHRLFDIVVQQTPGLIDERTRTLRERLIQEEFEELKEAMGKEDLVAIAKELADLLYVVYGTAVSYGIDMDPVFREVHRSNMSKIGGYKREDGKWVKPASYSPAAIAPILAEQTTRSGQVLESQRGAQEVQPGA